MTYKLSDIFNIKEIQELSESFTRLTGSATAVLDLEGNIFTNSGWQPLCTEFHRVNPISAARCRESDSIVAGKLKEGERYNIYRCKNGLVEVAVPITIDGIHIGNLFTGQFFFEPPDEQYFIRQADEYGFDKTEYLNALSKIPIFTEDYAKTLMDFLLYLADLLGEMGLTRIKLAEEVAQTRIKDQILYEQSRNISMSELLIDIAHHWRQPLCGVAIYVQEIRDAYRHNELNEAYLNKTVELAISELKSLSATIDKFRNFYLQDKKQKEFNISYEINNAYSIISDYLKDKGIVIDKEMDDSLMTMGYPNEFAHVILNILTNIKDKVERMNVPNATIRIRLYKDDIAGRTIITFADNCGSVSADIINKVFDPYFSTKDKSRGTGLGLFMAKIIIEKNMNGTISLRNIDGWCEVKIEL
ncbi:MAG: PocR ligand-binding domain-containing protein [Nitrospirae bacterium]|nr:PocR ligand-binding domain-containing protein [Nitrospirota bacterium]